MTANSNTSLSGYRVIAFESRRARETAELIRRYGGEPFIAPSMREIPLSENRAAVELVESLEARAVDLLVLLTGVGTKTLAEAAGTRYPRARFVAALGKAAIVARGPKPVAALKELGLAPDITVPEPNTWREILAELDSKLVLAGRRVAVQEYGVSNQKLLDGLEARGARVTRVPVYRWALPEDTGPLQEAVGKILRSEAEIVLFTNATQVDHLFRVAAAGRSEDSLRRRLRTLAIGSIGPVCTEALNEHGLEAHFEPEHPKLGHLIAEAARRGPALVSMLRAQHGGP